MSDSGPSHEAKMRDKEPLSWLVQRLARCTKEDVQALKNSNFNDESLQWAWDESTDPEAMLTLLDYLRPTGEHREPEANEVYCVPVNANATELQELATQLRRKYPNPLLWEDVESYYKRAWLYGP